VRLFYPFIKAGIHGGRIPRIESEFSEEEIVWVKEIYDEEKKELADIITAGLIKALNLVFAKDDKKDKANNRQLIRQKEFPFDHDYTRTKQEILSTNEALSMSASKGNIRSKMDMFDKERLDAYFSEIGEATSMAVIIKKRCSADGFLWNFYMQMKSHGIEPTLNMVKTYQKEITRTAMYKEKRITPPSPDVLINMLKRKEF